MDTSNYITSVDLSFEQLASALQRLPAQEKMALWRLLDKDIDRSAIATRFSRALQAIRSAYPDAEESKVMDDVLRTTREIRSERRDAHSRS